MTRETEEFIEKYNFWSPRNENHAQYAKDMAADLEIVIEAEKPRWIPVEEGLPELGQGILVLLRSGLITVGYRSQTDRGFAWQLFGDVHTIIDLLRDAVTHHQPLPQPPKQKSDG